ncbi:MAG: acyl-protein synthetase [Oscillospiraceae bacterium]|jgi:phenylacetate-coenzyme A ligase PaaK-like adenylate-forming protein|nr:acyl-protein synthetase [Oscillospiraceae bacterium]
MSNTLKLFYRRKPYNAAETDALFLRAKQENLRHHTEKCPEYAALLSSRGFSPEQLRDSSDLYKIPPIPTLYLKRHPMYSVPKKRLLMSTSSSGTSGNAVSVNGFDLTTAIRGAGMLARLMLAHKMLSLRPTNYIVLGYEPSRHNKTAVAKFVYSITFTAPGIHREYALRDTGQSYELNIDGLVSALVKYEKQGLPVRILGLPAYFKFLLEELKSRGIRLKLHPKSLVLLGGGWKQFFTERLEKPELYALTQEVLGIGETRIKEYFSAVEHPVPIEDCANHHFHVPIYSRVIIRDPVTLLPVADGTPGLLNLLTPLMNTMPFTSILTDDLAVLHSGQSCGCGNAAPWFEVLGRVGLADIKTCSADASELLTDLSAGAK